MVITPLHGSYPYLCQLTSANKNVLKLQFVLLKCETRFHLRHVKSKACHFQGLVLPLRHGVPRRHDSYAHLCLRVHALCPAADNAHRSMKRSTPWMGCSPQAPSYLHNARNPAFATRSASPTCLLGKLQFL